MAQGYGWGKPRHEQEKLPKDNRGEDEAQY
jgi:hypothetical protein